MTEKDLAAVMKHFDGSEYNFQDAAICFFNHEFHHACEIARQLHRSRREEAELTPIALFYKYALECMGSAPYTNFEAESLKDFICKKGYTHEELAEKLGVPRRTVALWEHGAALPSPKNAKALATLFNITVDEIYACMRKEDKDE